LNDIDIGMIARSCSWVEDRTPPLRLCIGAPSSPLLSNSILYDFDSIVYSKISAADLDVKYTRYADDLTFSSCDSHALSVLEAIVRDAVKEISYPRLIVNEGKTVRASKAGRRTVTGIVLTPDGKVSVGRDRKRLIRAMHHRSIRGLLSSKEQEKLNGLIAFVESVEPGFYERLNGGSDADGK
jgi:RNA-directed DNA polymerase